MSRNPKPESSHSPKADRISILNSGIFFLLLFIPFASVIAFGAVDPQAIGILAILSAFIFVLWLAESVNKGSFEYSRNLLQISIVGLIAIGLFQLLPLGSAGVSDGVLDLQASRALSMDPFSTRLFIVRLSICLIFFAAFLVFIRSRTRITRTVYILIVFGAVMAFVGIIQRLAQPEAIFGLRPTPQAIPFGSYVNQHHFAALMVMLSGLAISILLGSGLRRDMRPLLYVSLVLMGLAIVFTSSRGGMLSYLGVIGFSVATWMFVLRREPKKMSGDERAGVRRLFSAMAGGTALLALTLGLILFLGAGEGLLRGIGVSNMSEDFTSGRSHFWGIGWQIFTANPIIGTGLDTFGVAFTEFDTRNGTFRVEQAHNDYLQSLTDAGIAGFICIAGFMFVLFRRSMTLIAQASDSFSRAVLTGSLAGCFGILIHSFFDFPLRTTANGFIFLMLAAMATTSIPAKTSERRRENGEVSGP